MTRSQRRWHLGLWLFLAAVILLGMGLGLWSRMTNPLSAPRRAGAAVTAERVT